MNETTRDVPFGARGSLFATVWPRSLPSDGEAQHRRKLAVRTAHASMAGLVLAAVAGPIAIDFRRFTLVEMLTLALAGLALVAWSLVGIRQPVTRLLCEGSQVAPVNWAPGGAAQRLGYFTVQLGLAALVFYVGDRGRLTNLVWLVLLPPIAHSVILLRRGGVVAVCLVTVSVLVASVVRWHGWPLVPMALVAYGFAVLFTLVFTGLAVSSERSREVVQGLAADLAEANRKLREYAMQVEELAATRERNRVAREIHDSLGHYLTVVNVQIEAARAVQGQDPARALEALAKAQALTQEGLREIRRSVAALRASPLDDRSLPDALRQVVAESQAEGLAMEMEVLGAARNLPPRAELTLYRAGQEAATNIRKHSKASRAKLTLDFARPGLVRLAVADNGVGANGDAGTPSGFGLMGIRERAQLLGGAVRVRATPGAGFTLEVEVPG